MKHPGCSTEGMIDYIKTIPRKKPDTILLNMRKDDFTKGTKTIKNIGKRVEVIREPDNCENIRNTQISFSSIMHRSD